MRTPSALLVAVVAAAAATSTSTAHAAKPKPVTGSYDVVIPVPYPLEAADGSHCKDAPDTLSRDVRKLALPAYAGKLDIGVTEFVGDWVIEVYDAKGKVVATGATLDLTNGERKTSYRKKKAPAETLTVMVCNFGGTPAGTVGWTFTAA